MSDAKRLQAKGIRQFQDRDYEAAIATFVEAQVAYEQDGDKIGVAEQQVNSGLCYRALENYDKALELMENGLKVFKEEGDEHRQAQAMGNMALVYTKQGNNEQATTYYREAAALFKAQDDEDNYAETLQALADMQFKAGDLTQAVTTFEIALEHVGNPNMRQKMAKQLLVVKNRLLGENRPKSDQPSRRAQRKLRRENPEEDE